VPEPQIAGQLRSAKVEIAIGQAQIFIVDFAIELKGEIGGAIQNVQFAWKHLDIAGGKFRILRPWQAWSNFPDNLDYVFAP
jgi:hypothetical protein